jgi:cysteine desulfurase / selenocysteine lyase
MTFDVEAIRRDFPILSREIGGRPLVYLDSAATSHKPQSVIDAELDFYRLHNANAHRGIYTLAEEATELFEGARATIATFLGAPSPDTIVFTRGTTESINLVAHGWGRKFLAPGDEVLLTDMEHHSNIVPWQFTAQATGAMLRYIPLTDDGLLDLSDLGSLLTERTKILSVTGMSNALGTFPPLRELIDAAHAVGAIVLVDGAQFVPHHAVDVQDLGCDFLTFSGHKMLGPTASGGLYGRAELLDAMDPFLGGGEMITDVWLDHATWNEVPWKFEAGTQNVGDVIALGVAVDYLERLGMDAVMAHEREITGYALERLRQVPGLHILGPGLDERGGVVSFTMDGMHPHDIAQVLDQDGVCVRAGHHCTKPLHRKLGMAASVRASFYVYTIKEEIDALAAGLMKTKELFRVAG